MSVVYPQLRPSLLACSHDCGGEVFENLARSGTSRPSQAILNATPPSCPRPEDRPRAVPGRQQGALSKLA